MYIFLLFFKTYICFANKDNFHDKIELYIICITYYIELYEHIGRLARMSVLDTEVDGSNPGNSMLFPALLQWTQL